MLCPTLNACFLESRQAVLGRVRKLDTAPPGVGFGPVTCRRTLSAYPSRNAGAAHPARDSAYVASMRAISGLDCAPGKLYKYTVYVLPSLPLPDTPGRSSALQHVWRIVILDLSRVLQLLPCGGGTRNDYRG